MTIHRTDVTDNVISESPAAIERGSVKTEKTEIFIENANEATLCAAVLISICRVFLPASKICTF